MNDTRERTLPKWAKDELARLRRDLQDAREKLDDKIGGPVQRGHHGVCMLDPSCSTHYRSLSVVPEAAVSDGTLVVDVHIQDGVASVRASSVHGSGGMVIAPRAANYIEIRKGDHL